MPQRIQRKRTKGWRMPEGAVYVGRPSKWGNFLLACGDGGDSRGPELNDHVLTPHVAVQGFREFLKKEGSWCPVPAHKWPKGKIPGASMWTTVEDVKQELRGKDLACWCPLDQACHADVLLKIANES